MTKAEMEMKRKAEAMAVAVRVQALPVTSWAMPASRMAMHTSQLHRMALAT